MKPTPLMKQVEEIVKRMPDLGTQQEVRALASRVDVLDSHTSLLQQELDDLRRGVTSLKRQHKSLTFWTLIRKLWR